MLNVCLRTQLKASSAAAPSPPPSLQWKSPGWTFAIVMDQLCLIHIMMSCFYYTAPQFENQFLGVMQVWASEWPAVHRAPCHQLQHGRRIVFNIHNPLAHLTSLVCNSWNKLFIYLCLVPYLCFLFVITIWKLSWVAASSASKSYFEPDIDIKQPFIGFYAKYTLGMLYMYFIENTYYFNWKYKCNYNYKRMPSVFEQSKGLIWNSLWLNSVQNALVRVSFHICRAPMVYLRGGNNVHFRKRVDSDIEF